MIDGTNANRNSSNTQACGARVASEASSQPHYRQIKLALDVHAASIVVVRMVEGAKTLAQFDQRGSGSGSVRPGIQPDLSARKRCEWGHFLVESYFEIPHTQAVRLA